jgi:hypothetical protein
MGFLVKRLPQRPQGLFEVEPGGVRVIEAGSVFEQMNDPDWMSVLPGVVDLDLRSDVAYRCIDVDSALIHEFQESKSKEALGARSNAEVRILGHSLTGFLVGESKRANPDD